MFQLHKPENGKMISANGSGVFCRMQMSICSICMTRGNTKVYRFDTYFIILYCKRQDILQFFFFMFMFKILYNLCMLQILIIPLYRQIATDLWEYL